MEPIEEEKRKSIREKRYAVILGLWDVLVEIGEIDPTRFKLSYPIIDEVIEHYIEDWCIIKARYRIDKEIQLHKIAGLMAASILRYRPIVPLVDSFEDRKEIYVNEYFAIIHGLSVCGEKEVEASNKLTKYVWFNQWFDDFMHLVHRRNYTAESLAFIFETVSVFMFPKNLEVDKE